MKQLVCPISEEKINERITRINALATVLLTVTGIVFNSPIFIIFLMADFYIRAFTRLKYSPISYLSSKLANALNLNKKPIGKAQKIFAARLGFLMTLVITTLLLLDLGNVAIVVAGILVFLASLEFALGICVGCIIYTYFVLPFYKK
ncbi:MAG: DUF4395 domain-containing protein [Prolixibacteraceae bacterium]|nr:DUF4395 domain-containing protein [Prolixibacteraceae bacterium]MBT6005215.1 DUF4395 domain-containing protein [Prolixibacteraceae bacterium]MBT6766414.1 DUF4395 domain-containing protein [Prolixibacteraceae bacterium]MBT7000479.1 DUF4395 domain-containing protein [Prolixibacteraceae bacterium]MBT7393843.1 DUF4395 domain-containing protein [Prolixibacteraceae bacterium]